MSIRWDEEYIELTNYKDGLKQRFRRDAIHGYSMAEGDKCTALFTFGTFFGIKETPDEIDRMLGRRSI